MTKGLCLSTKKAIGGVLDDEANSDGEPMAQPPSTPPCATSPASPPVPLAPTTSSDKGLTLAHVVSLDTVFASLPEFEQVLLRQCRPYRGDSVHSRHVCPFLLPFPQRGRSRKFINAWTSCTSTAMGSSNFTCADSDR